MLKETGSGLVQVNKYDNLWSQAFNLQICKSVSELYEKTKTREGSSFPSFTEMSSGTSFCSIKK